jgi:UDP-glucose 4-epimerase
MSGPWYITPAAVRDYLHIRGWAEEQFESAQDNLIDLAKEMVAGGKQPVIDAKECLRYRTGRVHGRMTLVVSTVPRFEGDLPQLIAVNRSMH